MRRPSRTLRPICSEARGKGFSWSLIRRSRSPPPPPPTSNVGAPLWRGCPLPPPPPPRAGRPRELHWAESGCVALDYFVPIWWEHGSCRAFRMGRIKKVWEHGKVVVLTTSRQKMLRHRARPEGFQRDVRRHEELVRPDLWYELYREQIQEEGQ